MPMQAPMHIMARGSASSSGMFNSDKGESIENCIDMRLIASCLIIGG
jgi:hypothetical protein